MFLSSSNEIICNTNIKITGAIPKDINEVVFRFRTLVYQIPRLSAVRRIARDDML